MANLFHLAETGRFAGLVLAVLKIRQLCRNALVIPKARS
jgi:hypothetical protein